MMKYFNKFKMERSKNNNFVTLFTRLEDYHLSKDVGQIPYHMLKEHSYESHIVSYKNSLHYDISLVKGLNLFFIPRINISKISVSTIIFLIINAKNIKILNLFHIRIYNLIYIYIYKFFNKDGIVYVKGDLNAKDLKVNKLLENKLFKKHMGKFLLKYIGQKINILSVETMEAKKLLKKDYSKVFKKVILIPNGIDSDYVNENIEKKYSFDQKENIIITVARIGSTQKNNEMMLQALSCINLRNWKFYFIGSVESTFKIEIDRFFQNNPEKKENVLFIGNKDKVELYEYYNKAKVFCLTSLYEGFPLVFPEALYFGNYIISTDISSASDVVEYNNGVIIKDVNELANILEKIISNDFINDELIKQSYELSKNKFLWKKIINNLHKELSLC